MQDKWFFTNAENTVAQHIGESLAFADTNFNAGDPDDQEVFGICVRHRFFTFWHGIFPKEYLEAFRATPAKLKVCFLQLLKCNSNTILG